jgi:translation initiation factor IF-2
MAQRLIQVAKELNVGTGSIIEHLLKKGFEIDNKPTAIVSDEMLTELYREFQKSAAIKEEADKISFGTARPTVSNVPEPPKEEKPVVIKPNVEEYKPQLTVVGKIDLEPKKKEKPEPEPIQAVEPPKQEEKPIVEEIIPTPVEIIETVVETPVVDEDEVIRAEAPQLKGLKILGKIDTDKFDNQSQKKKELAKEVAKEKEKAANKPVTPPQSPGVSADDHKKKRKRKKVQQAPQASDRPKEGANKPKLPDAPKEVSKKEIDEKIKATMARLSAGGKKKRQKIRRDKRETFREKQELLEHDRENEKLQLTEFVTVSELASLLDVPVTEIIMTCMNLGVIVSINQRLDAEIIELVANEFGSEVEFISAEEQLIDESDDHDVEADLIPRAPIVTVMGHVDHGKTSLLDYIRSAKVAAGEAGGITQHVGAYEVTVGEDNKKITFLDTPGHEAFTAMRARGAKVTDIVIIVIAADDSIMPQTREAISHAQAAGVPMVFAINKVDKPGANPEKIKEALASMNLLVEDWGGTYQSQDISAKTGLGIDLLLEKILIQAELLELKANPNKKALGSTVEASLEKGKGYVTKVLVQNGTLNIGDPMVAGEYSGKVKAMFNERGKKILHAGPSTPVLVLGLNGAPQAGEKFRVTESDVEARQIATKRSQISREQSNRANKRISLEEIGRRLALGNFKELNIIVKGDVDGSVEALSDALIKQSIETVQVKVIHKAVGQIIESDVLLASASDAIIIGFQVRPSATARKLAEKEGVEIKLYSIIYNAIEEVRAAMEGMLEPTMIEKINGQIEVREVYKISKVGTVAGCYVQEGKVNRSNYIRIIRDGIVVFPTKEGAKGELSSLKRFKEDVKDVRSGFECGLTIKNYNDLEVNDIIEVYEIVEEKQTLK